MIKCIFNVMLLLAFVFNAKACDCDKIVGNDAAVLVFKGRIKNIKRIEVPFRKYEITFKVDHVSKGAIDGRRITINVPCLYVSCCGIELAKGEDYEVYTFERNGLQYTDECTKTKLIGKKGKFKDYMKKEKQE